MVKSYSYKGISFFIFFFLFWGEKLLYLLFCSGGVVCFLYRLTGHHGIAFVVFPIRRRHFINYLFSFFSRLFLFCFCFHFLRRPRILKNKRISNPNNCRGVKKNNSDNNGTTKSCTGIYKEWKLH